MKQQKQATQLRMKLRKSKQNNFMQKDKRWVWLLTAGILTAVFVALTLVIKFVDVGVDGAVEVGCATINFWWRDLVGTHQVWHLISDVCAGIVLLALGAVLVWQLILICRRKSWRGLARTWWAFNLALVILGLGYVFFQIVVINYRPLLVDGVQEAAYPSSHVLLLATVCPLLISAVGRTLSVNVWRCVITIASWLIMLLGIVARVLSGYHWLTDSFGAICFSIVILAWYQVLRCFMTCQEFSE